MIKRISLNFYPVILFLVLNFSCNTSTKPIAENWPIVVTEADGYMVPKDSLAAPQIILVDESKLTKTAVGKTVAEPTISIVAKAGEPEVVFTEAPSIFTPGKDGFNMPDKELAKVNTFLAGLPDRVIAKDAYAKELNPQNFSSFTKLQGLGSASVSCAIADSNRFLWFCGGTRLSKYDGKYFTNYTEKEGLGNNDIRSICEDRQGNIWFGTLGGGVSKFDGKYFTNFRESKGMNNSVWCMIEDKSGNMWFGTDGALIKYDGKYYTRYSEREGLGKDAYSVVSLMQDDSGNLWIGMDNGIISKYDGKSFTNFLIKDTTDDNFIWSIAEDRFKNIWFGMQDGGLYKYDGKRFTNYSNKQGLSDNSVNSILADSNGNLWISTANGVSKYDGMSFTNFNEKDGLQDNDVSTVLQDKSGNFWFCTNGGVSKYNGTRFTNFTDREGLPNNNATYIITDRYKNLWISTFGGVSKFNGKRFSKFTDNNILADNIVTMMLEDRQGNIWFSTFGGAILKYDGRYFTHFSTKEGLKSSLYTCIAKDTSGSIWFGSKRKGITKYDGKTFMNFTKSEGLICNSINCIMADRHNNTWFGTDSGISKFNSGSFTNFTINNGLSNNIINCISEDKNGNLWFGTNGGLIKYDGKYFITLTRKEGLSSNAIASIIEDSFGNLWIGTGMGLDELTQNKQAELNGKIKSGTVSDMDVFFKHYSYADGFLGISCRTNAMCEAKDGTIWIGASDRLTAYHPDALAVHDTSVPNIRIYSIGLFNEDISWRKLAENKDSAIVLGNGIEVSNIYFDSTSKWYGLPENLSLPYNSNYINFNFTGITSNQPERVKYQYKLEGMDDNWSTVTNRTSAPYGNLPYGSYTFKVKAMSSDGYWGKPLTYSFVIRPPWWKTWWAYSIYFLLLAFVLRRLHIYQKELTLKKEREKNLTRELEHAQEIEKAYSELKSTQSQLIQSEKMASLGELTAGIAHEIQNPLNFVNNFSEVNKEMIAELKEEIDKGNYDEVKIIADDIEANEEKINHHGKRADAIVKGMLQHSRTSTGKKEPADINALCDEYLRLAYHGLRAKEKDFNATMKKEFDEAIGNINLIPQDIGRVLLNLINNAFYAASLPSPENTGINSGGFSDSDKNSNPTVWVSTKKTGDKVLISVRDNGPGIPQKALDKIFQPFFTTKPTGQGTGLGLSLSYDIVKAHGGEMKLETKEGEGATFIISLPAE